MSADMSELVKASLLGKLDQLWAEVKQLTEPLTDAQLWTKPMPESNSIGHLLLHLTGNLNYYIGAQLGQTGYIRDREREFTETNVPDRETLLANLDAAIADARRIVAPLSAAQLASPHPEERFGTVLNALVHLVAHFALHRGQMSYLVRLVQ
ncbi:MAG: DinB family protein [Gemmataceae bacterium]